MFLPDSNYPNSIFIWLSVFFLLGMASCQDKKDDFELAETYLEPLDPAPSINENWSMVPTGLQASITSTNIRYVRSEIPQIETQTTWEQTVWKGERASAQLVLWSKDSVTEVKTTLSDFTSDSGYTLPASIADINFVKYVITDVFGEGCGHRKPDDFPASLAADVLEPISSYRIKAQETRPLWISINIPVDAKASVYKSTLTITVKGQKNIDMEFSVRVIDKTLPAPENWQFHLDLRQNPYAVARYHEVKPWSKEHWALLKPIMKRLADAGQKVITATLNKKPLGGQTYDPYESMVTWQKKSDGQWTYDYSIFDAWVQMMMELGVTKQISCYSMVPWGNEYYYFDEKENKEIKVIAAPGSPA